MSRYAAIGLGLLISLCQPLVGWADDLAPPVSPSPSKPAIELPASMIPITPATEQRSVGRAEWLLWLMKATNLQNVFVSEFPYYRDVDAQHPAYLAIESTRTKGWLDYWHTDAGYFKPDEPVSRLDALTTLGFSFQPSWFKRSLEDTQHLLLPYVTQIEGKTSAIQQLALAHCIDSEFAPKHPPSQAYLNQPLTLIEANAWLMKRRLLEQEQSPITVSKVIPAGLTLSVTPITALYAQQLTVGQYAYFAVDQDATLSVPPNVIPRGSRIRGIVSQASSDFRSVTVGFDKVILPSGDSYIIAASLPLAFEPMKLPPVDAQGKPHVPLLQRLLGRGGLPKTPKALKPSKKSKKEKNEEAATTANTALPAGSLLPPMAQPMTMTEGWIVPGQLYEITTQTASVQ